MTPDLIETFSYTAVWLVVIGLAVLVDLIFKKKRTQQ
jgi:hypothetical protein